MFRHSLGNQLELEILRSHHAPTLYALIDHNRAYLRRWMAWVDHTQEVEDIRKFIQTALGRFASGKGYELGVFYAGALIGVTGLHSVDSQNRKGALGYWIDEAHQGRGIITQACRAVIADAHEALALNRIEIRCASENSKSCAIPMRLGFEHEGRLRQMEWLYDHFVDHEVYGLVKESEGAKAVFSTEREQS